MAACGKHLTLILAQSEDGLNTVWIDDGGLALNEQQDAEYNESKRNSLGPPWKSEITWQNIEFPSQVNITDVTCGEYHCLALSSDGTLFAWGCDRFSKLGRPGHSMIPQPVKSLSHSQVSLLAAGSNHSAVIVL